MNSYKCLPDSRLIFSLLEIVRARHWRCHLAILAGCVAGAGVCQPDESVGVKNLSDPSPEWLVKSVAGDDFREPADSSRIKSEPYTAVADGRSSFTGTVYHQPDGSLTGKTLFAMAGHGWTYDSEEMYYYTQRGLSQGMVEDMGNADQMHVFAHLAFNSGANVFPFKPVDHQPQERVLDNMAPQVEFFGDWRQGSADQFFGAEDAAVRYSVTSASLVESAVARFRPFIPEAGYYPVYVWARDGADRCNQLYRVAYAGGSAEIRVNWRKAGKTWAWIGTYYFDKGWNGYVEASNQVLDPYEAYYGGVAVADAVRFGNGKGDVQRPGGVSGFSREDEGDSYWIERALGANADRRIFDIGVDGSSTVSSPPKAAAYANRETEGSFLDRILISFHSNASTGKARGAVGLFNAKAEQRPTYQESLAEYTGNMVNALMKSSPAPKVDKWSDRERSTYNGINFGELRRDYLQNEMSATIVETAFHDNKEDAQFLLDPMGRIRMAQATLRGVLKWFDAISHPNSVIELTPARPVALAATRVEGGKIALKWKLGGTSEIDGGEADVVRVYRSPNGYGFDGGVAVKIADTDKFTIDPLTTGGVTFIRVTAANEAGESFPSQTVAVGMAQNGKSALPTLLVPVTTVLDRSSNALYDLGIQTGGPYKETATTERVRPVYVMTEPAGAAEALSLAAAGQGFDGADTSALDEGMIMLSAYKRVFVAGENQNPGTALLSSKVQSDLRELLQKSGKVCLTGSGMVENGFDEGKKQITFIKEVAGITGVDRVPAESDVVSSEQRFLATTASLALKTTNRAWANDETVKPAAFIGRKGRSLDLLKYEGFPGAAAVLTRPYYSEGEVITVGFPLSLVKGASDREMLMQAILKQM